MAVYTDVSDEQLSAFLALYDIGDLRSCKGIAEGVENSNFLLTTTTNSFILTLYEKRVDASDLPFFLGLMEHLSSAGFQCPQPVKNRLGRSLGELNDRPAAIVTFLDGMWVKRPQTDHCFQLGRAMAEMHIASAGFSIGRPNALSVSGWRPLRNDIAKLNADNIQPGLEQLIDEELKVLEQIWPQDLPAGIIHADLFPDNVFFLQGRFSGFIDYYFACSDQFAYDIAICLNAWCFEADHMFNVTKAQALVAGYESVRKLENKELEALPLLARGAALRFLLTRSYDWLSVPKGAMVTPKNPDEYVRKLKFHRSIRDVSEFGLTANNQSAK